MKKKLLILSTAIGLACLGIIFFWPDSSPPAAIEQDDTGMTRHQTEELMRTIGYVQ